MLYNEARILLAIDRAKAELDAIRQGVTPASTATDVQRLLAQTYNVRPEIDILVEALNDAKDRIDTD